jgi:hypothetical protein
MVEEQPFSGGTLLLRPGFLSAQPTPDSLIERNSEDEKIERFR